MNLIGFILLVLSGIVSIFLRESECFFNKNENKTKIEVVLTIIVLLLLSSGMFMLFL